jgi:PEP-CTERM motif
MFTRKLATDLRPTIWLAALVTMAFAASATTARAGTLIGVSQDPPPPMTFVADNNNDDMIMVGGPTNPVPITPDPTTTTPWMKIFTINRDGQGWSTSGPLSMVSVMEFITLTPSPLPGTTFPRVVDWHEDIDPTFGDGGMFKWAGGVIDTPFGPFPGTTSADGKSIWFEFPPLPPGLPFKITKNLMWTGGVITPGQAGTNNYVIKINERPSVPEPATLVLVGLAFGGSAVGVRRRTNN